MFAVWEKRNTAARQIQELTASAVVMGKRNLMSPPEELANQRPERCFAVGHRDPSMPTTGTMQLVLVHCRNHKELLHRTKRSEPVHHTKQLELARQRSYLEMGPHRKRKELVDHRTTPELVRHKKNSGVAHQTKMLELAPRRKESRPAKIGFKKQIQVEVKKNEILYC